MTQVAGWRERVGVPAFGLQLDAKLDTGARGCALHATDLEPTADGRILFNIALDAFAKETVPAEAELIDWRYVKDSTGHGGLRPFIHLHLHLDGHVLREEVSLSDRLGLRHRLLIGRQAMRGRFVVDPDRSFVLTGHVRPEVVDGPALRAEAVDTPVQADATATGAASA